MIKYPTSFQTTDAIIVDRLKNQILLGKKPNQPKFRFLGGFVSPEDESLEMASVRERIEEGGKNLECHHPKYLFSFRVQDPRYLNTPDAILTAVFLHEYLFGFATAGDDIGEVQWFDLNVFKETYNDLLMTEHVPIAKKLIEVNYT